MLIGQPRTLAKSAVKLFIQPMQDSSPGNYLSMNPKLSSPPSQWTSGDEQVVGLDVVKTASMIWIDYSHVHLDVFRSLLPYFSHVESLLCI